MLESLFWLALGGVGGWVGAILQDAGRRWWLKRRIEEELSQLDEAGARLWDSYARALQGLATGVIVDESPLPLTRKVYESHYSEALLVLNRFKRAAMEQIHSYVDVLNEKGAELRALAKEINVAVRRRALKADDIDHYRKKIRAAMITSAQMRWHVHYYKRHVYFPSLESDSEELPEYREDIAARMLELDRIEESAKKLKPEQFDLRNVR